jgi:hypothetical protein
VVSASSALLVNSQPSAPNASKATFAAVLGGLVLQRADACAWLAPAQGFMPSDGTSPDIDDKSSELARRTHRVLCYFSECLLTAYQECQWCLCVDIGPVQRSITRHVEQNSSVAGSVSDALAELHKLVREHPTAAINGGDNHILLVFCAVLLRVNNRVVMAIDTQTRIPLGGKLRVQAAAWGLLRALVCKDDSVMQTLPKPMWNNGLNICYINSVMQCLLSCRCIVDYFHICQTLRDQKCEKVCRHLHLSQGTVDTAVCETRRQLYAEPSGGDAVIHMEVIFGKLVYTLMRTHLENTEMHDAAEFLMYVLLGKDVAAQEPYVNGLATNNLAMHSLITNSCFSRRRMLCKCGGGAGVVRRTASLRSIIHVCNFKSSPTKTLTESLNLAGYVPLTTCCEDCGFNCEAYYAYQVKCAHKNPDAQQEYDEANCLQEEVLQFFEFPASPVFLVQLTRFRVNGQGGCVKIHTVLQVEEYLLVCPTPAADAYTLRAESEEEACASADARYQLCAVCCHLGEAPDSGHYIAFVRRTGAANGARWFKMDDSMTEVEMEFSAVAAAVGATAYLLFYELVAV